MCNDTEMPRWSVQEAPDTYSLTTNMEKVVHGTSSHYDTVTLGDNSCVDDPSTTSSYTKESPRTVKAECTLSWPTVHGKKQSHLLAQHDYHDHAADPIVHCTVLSRPSSTTSKAKHPMPSRNCTTISFPLKLYNMIQKIEADGLAHVISWQPHGRCFQVHEPTKFKHLLLNYFKLSKLASFQRQLNLYGFQRLTVGLDQGSYYHELFIRGRPDLVPQIQRRKVKGTGVRAKSNPEDEPDLYLYPAVDGWTAMECSEPLSNALSTPSSDGMKLKNVPSLDDVTDATESIQKNTTRCIDDDMAMVDAVKYTQESYDHFQASCKNMNGIIRNISSMHLLSSVDNEISPSNVINSLFLPHGSIRNASFSDTHNNRPFITSAKYDGIFNSYENPFDSNDAITCKMVDDNNKGEATTAVETFNLVTCEDDEMIFDKLIAELFSLDQDVDYKSDLEKMVTEVNEDVCDMGRRSM
jgi:hypothetical protein